jgi:ribosomal protein L24E
MARRRVPVALCVALAVALGAAGAAGASRPAAPPTAPRAAIHLGNATAAIRRLASTADAHTVPSAPGAIVPFSLCWQRDYTDPAGDAPIDAIAYRLTYDCQTSTWRLSVTLAHAVDAATFDSLASEIDTDNDPNNGCDGFDLLVAGVFDSRGVPKGVLVATPTCDSSTWTTVSSAGFAASGTALALTYSETALANAPRLIWNAGVVPKAQTDPVDELPDQGVLVADKFLPQTDAHDGYLLVDGAGGVHAYGNARFRGDLSGTHLAQPIVGMAREPDRSGYWLLGRDGGVFTFGAASFYGSTGHLRLQRPVVGMASTRAGHGYWFVAADGGIFSFGDARFWGSTGALHLNKPIVGMAPTRSGKGYWLVASDGGIFSFGDAAFHGSTGARALNRPIVGMAATPTGDGYWLVASDGGIFSFGDARFHGSTGALRLLSPIVGMTTSPTGSGYRFVAADGGIFSFGDAAFLGGLGGGRPPSPIVGMG